MGARNAATVQAMWEAFQREGLEGFLRLAPDDVEWHPHLAEGQTLRGTRELRDFFDTLEATGSSFQVRVDAVEEISDDVVLLTGAITRDAQVRELAWLYCFRDGKLWRASSHPTAEQARQAARFLAAAPVRWARAHQHLEIDETRENGCFVLRPAGELDLATAGYLTAAMHRGADETGDVLVDLSGLTFMDSSGLRCLLEAAENARDSGWQLTLLPGPEPVQRVFSIAGVDHLLPFRTDG